MPKLRVITKTPPEPQGEPEQQVAQLRDYLLQLCEELAYVLTHLEADNINDSTFERIQEMIPKAYTGLPPMDGAASSGGTNAWSRGDHRHPHDDSKADAADLTAHVGDTANPHSVTKAQVGLGNVDNVQQYSASNPPPIPTPAEVGAIPTTEKGSAGGVAELDSNGMVPSAQLPSYVDDVLEYASLSAFPATGESGKIYVALDTNKTYRWSGSAYVEISPSLALGETSSTAYRGDRGKTAYDHSQVTSGNPHNVTAAEVGLGNVANERQYSANNPPPLPTPVDIGAAEAQDLTDHVGDTNNPHSVTAVQAGARPDTWMPTASDVGARPDTWTPTAADVGARPDTWTPTAADVGARPDDWVPDAEDVPYDNTGSGLMATDVQNAIDELAQGGGGGGTAASAVSYDNTGSGLAATNVQDAIDEVYGDIPTQASDIGAQPTITANGILKGDGAGGVSAAVAGTDYQAPLTAGTDYATPGMIPTVPSAYTSNPAMDGTASPGSSGAWARGDHVHPSDTSKANETEIAYVETGSTASRAYSIGEYFCWGGLLYRAKTAIASGASFTVGANCEQVPEGIGNSIQAISTTSITPTSVNPLPSGVSGTIFVTRIGKLRFVNLYNVVLANYSPGTTICTLGQGDRPKTLYRGNYGAQVSARSTGNWTQATQKVCFVRQNDGDIILYGDYTAGWYITGTLIIIAEG